MPLQETKLALKKALAVDLDVGLKWLDAWVGKNTDSYTELLMHRSNYQTIKNEQRKQLLDPDTAHRRIAVTRYALMSLVDELNEQEVDTDFDHTAFREQLQQLEKEKEADIETEPVPPSYRKWIVGVFLMSLAGLLIWWGYTNGIAKGEDLSATFDLSMIIYGDSAKSQIIRTGTLRLLHKGKPESLAIGQDGRVVWSNVLNAARNTSFQINPQVEDYQPEQITLQIPATGKTLEVILRPIQHQTKISGNVQVKGKPGAKLEVDIAGITTTTDEKGDFEKVVPFKKGTEVRIRIFKDNQEVYNGMERISNQLIPVTID